MPAVLVTAPTVATAATMGVQPTGDPEQIILDGVPIPILSMSFSELARFEEKLTVGDYSKDSDALLSTWAQSAWNGGLLVDEHLEGGTDQRGRWSTLWTRSPGQLALNPLAVTYSAGDDPHRPVGDYADAFWFAEGLNLQTIDDPDTTYTLTAPPVAVGVEYDGDLVIPLGGGGIDIFDGAAITNDPAITAVSLLIWDDKLYALQITGEVVWWDSATWSTPSSAVTIPSRDIPRKLVAFFDRAGNLTPTAITSRGIWMLDVDATVLHKTRLDLPPHPDNGLAAAEWRDDGLFYAAGLGVYRHSASGVLTAMGLDRDDGVPTAYRGRIVDMIPEHNGLLALLEGSPVEEAAVTDTAEWDHGPFIDNPSFVNTSDPSQGAIMLWNEAGWHCLHNFREIKTPTWMYLSTAEIDDWSYTLICGQEDQLVRIKLPTIFFGPRQLVQSQVQSFEPDGIHETGRFDAGMVGFQKLATHFELTLRDPQDGKPFAGSLAVSYRTDVTPTWTALGTASDYGRHVFPFNVVDDFVRGVTWTWIEFKYAMARGSDPLRTPIIDYTVLKFIKVPLPGRTWTATIDLEVEQWGPYGPEQLAAFIEGLTTSETLTKMRHLGQDYRVRISQVNGAEAAHVDGRKAITLTIVEIRIPGYD